MFNITSLKYPLKISNSWLDMLNPPCPITLLSVTLFPKNVPLINIPLETNPLIALRMEQITETITEK